ncbi:MAG: signal peptidase II [Lachnospiraceae bacterium]|nr:signal peptidase II [Lachnospiraceae bacterium]
MLYIVIVGIIFAGDFLIKNNMEKKLKEGEIRKKLGGILWLRKYHNRGAFLNVGEKKASVVVALSVLLTLAVATAFVITLGTKGNRLLKTGLSLLLGGAFSNTYDRLKKKYVMDYFSFGGGKKISDIVFNLSDFGIIIGAMLVAVASYLFDCSDKESTLT